MMKMRLRPNNKKHISIEINGKREEKSLSFLIGKTGPKMLRTTFQSP